MKQLFNLRFTLVYNILSVLVLTIIFSIYGYYVVNTEKSRILKDTDNRFFVHLNDLSDILDIYFKQKSELLAKNYNDSLIEINKEFNNELNAVSEIFNSKKYLKTSYAFILDKKGTYLVHPFLEGKNVISSEVFEKIVLTSNGKTHLKNINDEDIQSQKIIYYKYYDPIKSFLGISVNEEDVYASIHSLIISLLKTYLIVLVIFVLLNTLLLKTLIKLITNISKTLMIMSKGKVAEKLEVSDIKEIKTIVNPLNTLIQGLEDSTSFANEISQGNLHANYIPLSDSDVLGNSLLNMRKSLIDAKEDEKLRKKEDDQRNWASEGLAKFSELLRENNSNMEILANEILKNIVEYLKANQGGLFLYNDDNKDEIYLELVSAYAYSRKKFLEKKIHIGDGFIGNCALEKQTIFVTDIPEDYIEITSGLGTSNPRNLLIVPMKIEDNIFGIIELASFKIFEQYEIDFIERIASSTATTIANLKINIHTANLLRETQEQAKKMADQEEEMRMNMEELQATQEEAAKQSELLASFTNSVNHTLIRAEYDTEGTLLYANTKFLTKLGYISNREVEGQHISMFINEKDREWFFQIWDKLSKGGKHFEGDMKHVTKQGKDLWTMATYTCVRDNNGSVEKILFLAIDTTEQKKQSLDYEGQIQALNNSTMKAEFEPSGKMIHCNPYFMESFGFDSIEDIKIKNIFDFIVKDDLDEFKRTWKSTINGKPSQGQSLRVTNLDEKRWLHETFTAVNDMYGEVAKVIYVANDISEQKKMEQETIRQANELKNKENDLLQNIEELQVLQEEMRKNQVALQDSEKKLKKQLEVIEAEKKKNSTILEGCVEGIITFDQDGVIDHLNKAAEEIIGCEKEQLLGKNIDIIIDLKLEKEKDGFGAYYQNGETKRLNNSKSEINIKTIEGNEVSVLLTLNDIKLNNGCTFAAFLQNIEVELF